MNIPIHIAIIIDGNRRWAKEKGLPTLVGHKKGTENVRKIIKQAQKLGVQFLTFYCFSTENWNRTKKEIDYLMDLFTLFIKKNLEEMAKENIVFKHIGDPKKLPKRLQKALFDACEKTKNNSGTVVSLALNYGGRDEITRAIRKIIQEKIKPEDITDKVINDHLDTVSLPYPDLLIRTSGEQRLSGFLLWQGAYTELYFPKTYWPDFKEEDLDMAIAEFKKRQRRFGK